MHSNQSYWSPSQSDKTYFTGIQPFLGSSNRLPLEELSHKIEKNEFDSIILQSMVNEGKELLAINTKKPKYCYDEKILRDAAAAEVANVCTTYTEDFGKSLSRKRKNMDVSEKVQDSRDRNREHAKNTRLRKKAYVIKLKELAEHLEKQKKEEEDLKISNALQLVNRNITRRNTIRLFLSYREANVQDRHAWEAILDDNFVFTLPITPYRSFLKRDVINGSRMLVGIDAVMADTSSLFVMVESIGQGSNLWKESMKRGSECRLVYTIGQQDFHSSNDVVMCKYIMRVDGFEGVGAMSPCEQYGMLLCRFSPVTNKIISTEMVFDVMGFMQELQHTSSITPETSVIPNTVDMALQPSKESRAIMKSDPPLFPVLHINAAWTELSGIPQSEAIGMPFCDVLHLMPSQFEQLCALVAKCLVGQAGSAVLVTQCPVTPEQPALIYLKMFPLTSNTETTITHFLGIHTDLPLSVIEKKALLSHCKTATMNAGRAAASSSIGSHNSIPGGFPSNLLPIDYQTLQSIPAMPAMTKPMPIVFNQTNNRFEQNMSEYESKPPMGYSNSNSKYNRSDLPSNFHGVSYSANGLHHPDKASIYFNTNDKSEHILNRNDVSSSFGTIDAANSTIHTNDNSFGTFSDIQRSELGHTITSSTKRYRSDRYQMNNH